MTVKIDYNRKGILFNAEGLQDSLIVSECLTNAGLTATKEKVSITIGGITQNKDRNRNPLSWHDLVKAPGEDLAKHTSIKELEHWGATVDPESLQRSNQVIQSKIKSYLKDKTSISEMKNTPFFKTNLSLIKEKYGKPFADGSSAFEYQLESAAMLLTNRRTILALDMGMGKTRTTLMALTADPSIKKSLIVVQSRNINDWEREIKVLGLQDEYIILKSPKDLGSAKRISLVSYEKWSKETTIFRKKRNGRCGHCNTCFLYKHESGICRNCSKKTPLSEERYSEDDRPIECPNCLNEWTTGKNQCACGFSIVEKRSKSLSHFFHKGFDAACIDEGTNIKRGGASKKGRSILKIDTKIRIILSGTPASNRIDDIYYLLAWLIGGKSSFEDPFLLEPFQKYSPRSAKHFSGYFTGGGQQNVLDTDRIQAAVSHTQELWELLDTVMLRKRKTDEDVKDDIRVPEPVHHRQHLTMTPEDESLYTSIVEEFREWFELEKIKKTAAESRGENYLISRVMILTWMDKLRKAASCPWTFKNYNKPKLHEPTKIQFLKAKAKDHLRKGQKILIFTAHKQTSVDLGQFMDGVLPGREAAYINGDVPMKKRFELLNRFQDQSDALSILILTCRTGAESYTLTEAKAVFLYDLEYNPSTIDQCYSRAVRLGQQDVVDIYWLLTKQTIDMNMHGYILSKKWSIEKGIDRKEFDFKTVASEFKGEAEDEDTSLDYESFAADMLQQGTNRKQLYGEGA